MNTDQTTIGIQKKQENPWLSILFNLVIPTLILTKLSRADRLGAEAGFAIALAFPFIYAIYDFIKRKKLNFIAVLGFVGILVKGGLGFFKLNNFWFAVNEAAIPSLIAIVLFVSILLKRPLIGMFFLNDNIVNLDLIKKAISEKRAEREFQRSIVIATYLLVVSFLISAVLNFYFAIYLLKSPVGTEQFNEEMGYMNAISIPVIIVCSTSVMVFALWRFVTHLMKLTDLEFEQIFKTHPPKASTKEPIQ